MPPHVAMVNQPYLSYQQEPMGHGNMINRNPQEIIPS